MKDIRVYFGNGYGGTIRAGVRWGDEQIGHTIAEIERDQLDPGEDYVIDLVWLRRYLEKQILEKGYTISQTKRQKYPRLTINE